MRHYTHGLFSIFISFLIFYFFKTNINLLFVILCVTGGLLPDIDKYGSKISKKTLPFSLFLNAFKHRGFFHSLIFVLMIIAAFVYGFPVLFLLVGVLGHILLDFLTNSGVLLFWPIEKRVRFKLGPTIINEWIVIITSVIGTIIIGLIKLA